MRTRPEISAIVALRPHAWAVWMRVALLLLVGFSVLITELRWKNVAWITVLVIAALPGLLWPGHPVLDRAGRIAEVIASCLGAVYVTGPLGSTLPYLVAPILIAGLFVGFINAMALISLAIATLTIAAIHSSVLATSAFGLPVVQWLVVSFGGGLLGAWIRDIWLSRTQQPESDYVQASRLLTQLRTIARQLPGTLDPGSIAERLLSELCSIAPAEHAAVFTGSGGGRLEVLAQHADERLAWETSLDGDSAIAEAWASQRPQLSTRSLIRQSSEQQTDKTVSALVLPLITGVRTVGLVVLETNRAAAYSSEIVTTADELAAHAALRLETALLFDEVRSIATTEERQRLAREIHDGVAQELVMVGYGIDNAIASLPDDSQPAQQLQALRAEVTRVITELRLSLFELRSDVDRHGGLGSAIAEYARTVGTSAGLRVHLSLDESTARLPAAVESELLRIAQEAITNARKHAQAANLWVGCEVNPPRVRITVSDDGTGLSEQISRKSSYGMSIMAERAERVRANLAITPRQPHGTTVTVVLGGNGDSGQGTVSVE